MRAAPMTGVNALPSADVLASLVSNVTQTMLGIVFAPDVAAEPSGELQWKTALLPIPGARPITVGLSSDRSSCAALSSAMFSVEPDAVDAEMVDDSLRELLNMTAGLVKGALALDQPLGLPKVFGAADTPPMSPPPMGRSLVLRAEGLGIVLWVCDGLLIKT